MTPRTWRRRLPALVRQELAPSTLTSSTESMENHSTIGASRLKVRSHSSPHIFLHMVSLLKLAHRWRKTQHATLMTTIKPTNTCWLTTCFLRLACTTTKSLTGRCPVTNAVTTRCIGRRGTTKASAVRLIHIETVVVIGTCVRPIVTLRALQQGRAWKLPTNNSTTTLVLAKHSNCRCAPPMVFRWARLMWNRLKV